MKKCENCRFWDDPDEETGGTCVRYPPRSNSDERNRYTFTEAGYWCGEWKPVSNNRAPLVGRNIAKIATRADELWALWTLRGYRPDPDILQKLVEIRDLSNEVLDQQQGG